MTRPLNILSLGAGVQSSTLALLPEHGLLPELDAKIRHCGGMRGEMFVHRDLVPLGEADIRSAEDRGQLSLWEDECLGMCGV